MVWHREWYDVWAGLQDGNHCQTDLYRFRVIKCRGTHSDQKDSKVELEELASDSPVPGKLHTYADSEAGYYSERNYPDYVPVSDAHDGEDLGRSSRNVPGRYLYRIRVADDEITDYISL